MFNLPPPPAAPAGIEPNAQASVDSAAQPPEPVKEEARNDAGQPSVVRKDKPNNDKKNESGIAADPYEWGQCAIAMHIVWLPGGQVLAGVRSHLDAPIITALSPDELTSLPGHAAELPLPTHEALADLLAQLREDLPNRAKAKAERDEAATKKASGSTNATQTTKQSKPAAKRADGKKAETESAEPAKTRDSKKTPPPAQVSLFDLLTGTR
jgi:hypothetical protein